jgi:hypothetical protein
MISSCDEQDPDMHSSLDEVIRKIYVAGDHAFFLSRAGQSPALPAQLTTLLGDPSHTLVEFHGRQRCWPSMKWVLRFPKVRQGEFEVEFRSMLELSKLAPAYSLSHEFSVENRDPQRSAPTLDGVSVQPHSHAQLDLDRNVAEILAAAGFVRLGDHQLREVICSVSLPDQSGRGGRQLTVEAALFDDPLRLCVQAS